MTIIFALMVLLVTVLVTTITNLYDLNVQLQISMTLLYNYKSLWPYRTITNLYDLTM